MDQFFIEAFTNGINCLNNKEYINARKWFEISSNSDEYRDKSLNNLIYIDLIEGKYAKARKQLETSADKENLETKQLFGLLENIENNYETSKKYYSECMIDPKMQNKSLMQIARLYVQTGDNEIAKKIFETLQLNKHFWIASTFDLIYLNILEQNYTEAEKVLKSIDITELDPTSLQNYQILSIYIKYFLGVLKESDKTFDAIKNYVINRLLDNSDETLLNHIKKHMNQKDRNNYGCFFKYLDLGRLLSDVKDKIEDMNGNHHYNKDIYKFKLDTPIGFKGEEITSDLCVVTIIGTKKIITMYPVSLSSQFDKEGYSTSQELMLKRNYRGLKR